MPSTASHIVSASENALARVKFQPVPDWAILHEAPADVARKDGDVLTQLLIDLQHHRQDQAVFQHRVIRLESMDAVQHLSQWTLDFCPLTQHIILHDLTVIRGGERKQYAHPDNIRLLNRERNLEAFIVDGLATLLIVLADIRVGDIIDQSLTIVTRPHLLTEEFFDFYSLPVQTQIGAFYYSVTAPAGKLPQWRGSESMGEPETIAEDGSERLLWRREGVSRFESEPNVPAWHMPPAWLQFSSLDSWESASRATAAAWPRCGDGTEIETYIASVKAEHPTLEAQIEAVLRFVQDDFRYLSVNEAVGGQIPSAPDTVLGRRYGDCKDLSLLLTEFLARLGVRARPLVVNATIGKTLPQLLPSLDLFNHAIVSFFYEDREYWVDPTLSTQGGGPFRRAVGEFTHGLPIETAGVGLLSQPDSGSRDSYQLYDTLLLDTAGGHSLLRIQILATGRHADGFRNRLHRAGEEGFRQDLINQTRERYKVEEMPDKPVYEDDRDANIWRMVEVYQLPRLQGSQNGQYGVSLPDGLPLMLLPFPDDKKRQAPFAVPTDIDITHTTEIRSPANRRQPGRAERATFNDIHLTVDTRFRDQIWKHVVSLKSGTDHILPKDIDVFRTSFRKPMQEAGMSIQLPRGHRRPRRGKDFLELLPLSSATPEAGKINGPPPKKATREFHPSVKKYRSHSSGSRRPAGSHTDNKRSTAVIWVVIGFIALVVKFVLLLMRNN